MRNCVCFFFLVLCLVGPEPSYSQNPLAQRFKRLFGTFGFGDSSSSSEEEESGDSDENIFLSRVLSDPNFRATADKCEENGKPVCDPRSPYRTYDGSCNNLQHPTWGSVNDCLPRILPPAYEGYSGMRKSVNGAPLPTARHLTLNIFTNQDRPEPEVTLLFTTFGQVVAHDQSLSTVPRDPGMNCCLKSHDENPDCAPIFVDKEDPFYSNFNQTCFNFVRTLQCSSCKRTGKRNIPNIVTSALDVSIAYGLNNSAADRLRTKEGGKLKVRFTKRGTLLPENTDPRIPFCPAMQTSSCFMTGDLRVNQHTNLAALHTMLVREHNRMAHNLEIINPHWDDEKLYQTARKILGAKMQAIVYNEYLPVLLGRQYMDKFKLTVIRGGRGTKYNPTLRFGAWVEHSTGAFRAHSMIPTRTGYRGKKFRDLFSNNFPILEGNMAQVIKGSFKVPSQQYDHFYVPDVTNYLYKQPHVFYGEDLVANDILRGRDHGLPTYIEVLKYCSGNDDIYEFDQLSEVMPQKHIRILKQNYEDVQDVDLYVGIQMEDIMEGSLLTPTAACVVSGHFYFSKYGDRFYFEHVNEAPSFTAAQRESLKRSSIARMICTNNNIAILQINAFLFENRNNPNIPCSILPDVDLSLWKSSK